MAKNVPDDLAIVGMPVSVFDSCDEAAQFVRQRISSGRRTLCVAINPEKIYRAKHDARLKGILDSADIRLCDGAGISVAAMLLHRRLLPRCTGIDLFFKLLGLSAEEGWKVFLLGASPQSNDAACRALLKHFPGLKLVGSLHGYFNDSAAVVNKINESGADLLFVAMGSPRQEFWISEHMLQLKPTFFMGIGGSLDVAGGTVQRAPRLFRKTGMEWLFRLILQPSRLSRERPLLLFAVEVLRVMSRSRQPAPNGGDRLTTPEN